MKCLNLSFMKWYALKKYLEFKSSVQFRSDCVSCYLHSHSPDLCKQWLRDAYLGRNNFTLPYAPGDIKDQLIEVW